MDFYPLSRDELEIIASNLGIPAGSLTATNVLSYFASQPIQYNTVRVMINHTRR